MEENENCYVYEQVNNEDNEDRMYIINDDSNINIENFQDFQLSENMMQFPDGQCLEGDHYVVYDDSGKAYMIDPSNFENNQDDLYVDSSDQNNNLITYSCPSCTQVYQNANAFTKHTREKHHIKVFTCRQCEQFFENLSLLFLHARRTHVDPRKPIKNPGSYKFHCPDCNYMTNNGGTMEHHRRAHSGVKPYQCDICHKSFAQKANMKTHKNRHIHKDRVFKCDICSKSFNSHDIYLAHLRTREHELQEHFQVVSTHKMQIQCLGCNMQFNNYYDITTHMSKCDILKDIGDKFWCVHCKVEIANLVSLKFHIKSHGNKQIINCPVCGERGFPGFNQLNHHITRAHALKVNRRNVCRYCEMTFETKDLLEKHIEDMHISEKNGRQSRGAVGRLRCRFDECEFTSNSVMLMDRHHDQHINNTLPSTIKKPVKRPRRRALPAIEKEEMIDAEIENFHSHIDVNEILRLNDENDIKLEEFVEENNTEIGTNVDEDCIDDMDVDDLEKLAASYVEKPINNNPSNVKRKRGRPRKLPKVIKNENFDVVTYDDFQLVTDKYPVGPIANNNYPAGPIANNNSYDARSLTTDHYGEHSLFTETFDNRLLANQTYADDGFVKVDDYCDNTSNDIVYS